MWPTPGADSINEFNTEGYIPCAFPTSFPTGAADLLAPRNRTVTVGMYFNPLNADGVYICARALLPCADGIYLLSDD